MAETLAAQFSEYAVKDAEDISNRATNSKQELILPAIYDIETFLATAVRAGAFKRIATSLSLASTVDIDKTLSDDVIQSADDWNPLTYEKAGDLLTIAVVAYRGSNKFAGPAAWESIRERKTSLDLVAFCLTMTFCPVVHPGAVELNGSNAKL